MKLSQPSRNDTQRLVRRIDNVIIRHRDYFAAWRAERWNDFEKRNRDRLAARADVKLKG